MTNHLARWLDHRLALLVHQGSDPTPPFQALVIRESAKPLANGLPLATHGVHRLAGPVGQRGMRSHVDSPVHFRVVGGREAGARRVRRSREAGATGDGKRPVAAFARMRAHPTPPSAGHLSTPMVNQMRNTLGRRKMRNNAST
jgi:hypothetical protein